MKKILKEMQIDMKNPPNSIEVLKKFLQLFPQQDSIKVIFQYLLRLYDIYKSENNQIEKNKILENLKKLCFTDNLLHNFNRNFDFPKPLNSEISDNFEQDISGDPGIDFPKSNVIKSELTKEMISLLYPDKIVEIFNKIYNQNNNIQSNSSNLNFNSNPLNHVNLNIINSFRNTSENFCDFNKFDQPNYSASEKEQKDIMTLEILKIINPMYLYKYFDIEKFDGKLFLYFLTNVEEEYYITSLFFMNSNFKSNALITNTNQSVPCNNISAKSDENYLIKLIKIFLTNYLKKYLDPSKKETLDDMKTIFMLKIPYILTLEQVEKIVNELDKSIPVDIIHWNFWLDLLLRKKFKNEINNDDKYLTYLKILEYIKDKNFPYFQIFKSYILLYLLKLNTEFYNYDLNLFMEYIETPFFGTKELNNKIYKIQIKNENEVPDFISVGNPFMLGLKGNLLDKKQPNEDGKKYCFNYEFEMGYFNQLGLVLGHEEQGILEKHLNHYFVKENQKIDKFSYILQESFLKKIYYKAKIYRGFDKDFTKLNLNQSISNSQSENNEESSLLINKEDFSQFFSKVEFERLVKKTELTILKLNKTQFKIIDEVVIDIEFKNIQNLILKLFEINTENFYYNSKKALDPTINVEGLIPFHEEIFIYNEKPEKLISKTFKLDKIPNKRGVYIAEFMGKGISVRAIIKKGNLKLITKQQSKGVNFFIIDEDNKICLPLEKNQNEENKQKESDKNTTEQNKNLNHEINKNIDNNDNISEKNTASPTAEFKNLEKKTGVLYRNKFYSADKSGLIIVPYSNNEQNIQSTNDLCIISHMGFSEIANLNIDKEIYTLKGYFFTEEETLIAGNTAKFIARPALFLNNFESKNFLLKNIKITATIKNEVNGEIIPSNKIWDKIKLNQFFEYAFDLQVPSRVTSIILSFEAEVFNNSNRLNQKLKFEEEFKINNHYSAQEKKFSSKIVNKEMRKLFLKKSSENNYSIFVLGKNGEPVKNAIVCLKLFHKHLNFSDISLNWNSDNNFNITSEIVCDNIQLESMLKTYSSTFSKICLILCFKRFFLQTDQNGEIKLGNLNDFRYLLTYLIVDEEKTINNEDYEIWNLENEQKFIYPKRIDKIENEQLVFPLKKKNINNSSNNKEQEVKENNVILFQVFKDGEIYNVINDKLSFIDFSNKDVIENIEETEIRRAVKIPCLTEGRYKLILGDENEIININIHKGTYWEINDFIISKNYEYICENVEGYNMPILENFILNLKNESIKIKINETQKLSKNSEIENKLESEENKPTNNEEIVKKENSVNYMNKFRIHLLAFNFLKNESFIFTEKHLLANKDKTTISKQKIKNWDSLFLESRCLNEEVQYVHERKNYEKLLGNSLEKPTLLMKKKFIRKTQNVKNPIDKGTEYKKREIPINNYNKIKSHCKIIDKKKKKSENLEYENSIDFQRIFSDSNNFLERANTFKTNKYNEFSRFKNFLFESSKFIIDIPIIPGEIKEIKIPDLSKYSNLQIICTENCYDGTKFNCFEELIILNNSTVEKSKNEKIKDNLNVKFKDIRLKKALDLTSNFTELRTCEIVNKDKEYIIDDILSYNFKLIDSLEKVSEFQIFLNNPSGNQDIELKKKLEEYSFLFKFDELSLEKQKDKISKYFSHEFNFYIYMKYPKIFNDLILPIIKFKMDKKFIDYILIGDENQVSKFLNMNYFNSLNLFEKCLLIKFLSQRDQNLAKKLSVLLKPQNYEYFEKSLFDLMIHSKTDSNTNKNNNLEDFVSHNNLLNENLDQQFGLFGLSNNVNNNNMNNNNLNSNFNNNLSNNLFNQMPMQQLPFNLLPNSNNNISICQLQTVQAPSSSFSNNSNIAQFSNVYPRIQQLAYPQQLLSNSLFGSQINNTNTVFQQQAYPQQSQSSGLFGGQISNTNSVFQQQAYQQQSQSNNLFGGAGTLFSNSIMPQNMNNNMNINSYSNRINNNLNVNDDYNIYSNQAYQKKLVFSDHQISKQRKIRNQVDCDKSIICEYVETHNMAGHYSILNLKFWYDYSKYVSENQSDKNFITKNIIENTYDFKTLLVSLAVLDLPQYSLEHVYEKDPEKRLSIKIKSASNFILFTKKLSKTEKNINQNLIVNQKIYLYNCDENCKNDFADKEFLLNRIYCHETNIINTTYETFNFDLLIQVPEGAIPLLNSDYKKVINISMKNEIKTFKTFFYFPKDGEFNQHGPSLSQDGLVIAKSENRFYKVLNKLTEISKVNIQNILECGKKKDILEFFRTNQNSINRSNLSKVYWILKDKKFFEDIISILKDKYFFDIEVWAFAFYHKSEELIKEFLENMDSLKKLLGPVFVSGLFEFDEVACLNYEKFEHKEYFPIVNNRIIYINNNKNFYENIENLNFRKTYENFLILLFEKNNSYDNKDYLKFVYYLLLQDRVPEAKAVFTKIENLSINNNSFSSIEIFYDYVNAYLDFSDDSSEFKKARDICKKYENFPLKR